MKWKDLLSPMCRKLRLSASLDLGMELKPEGCTELADVLSDMAENLDGFVANYLFWSRVRRTFALAVVLVCAGCGPDYSNPMPEKTCLVIGPEREFCGGRGGCSRYNECLQYGISCPKPLTLTTDPENRLVCRLKETQ